MCVGCVPYLPLNVIAGCIFAFLVYFLLLQRVLPLLCSSLCVMVLIFVVFFMCILVLECDFLCVSGFGMCVCLMLLYCVFCISKVLLLL